MWGALIRIDLTDMNLTTILFFFLRSGVLFRFMKCQHLENNIGVGDFNQEPKFEVFEEKSFRIA